MGPLKLTPSERALLEVMPGLHADAPVAEWARRAGVSYWTASRKLRRLIGLGLIPRAAVGDRRRGPAPAAQLDGRRRGLVETMVAEALGHAAAVAGRWPTLDAEAQSLAGWLLCRAALAWPGTGSWVAYARAWIRKCGPAARQSGRPLGYRGPGQGRAPRVVSLGSIGPPVDRRSLSPPDAAILAEELDLIRGGPS